MPIATADMRARLTEYGQEHILRFWGTLDGPQQEAFTAQVSAVDFPLISRLIEDWVHHEPPAESFDRIAPVPLISKADPGAREAWEAGEEALRQGQVGLFLVAGGQGTRLGFSGPKGAYPIGPVSGRTFFEFHAEKIHNIQNRYGCTLPWYIMVSHDNEQATRDFFEKNQFLGLKPEDIYFSRQRMMPCVDEEGRFILATPSQLAMNPNGHGGCIPAMVEEGILRDARERGVELLSYFQVDNWTVKVADPLFIGYHVLRRAEMSSKNHIKNHPREAVGVHCLCDGEYRVIEYSELDIYPQLLETDDAGHVVFDAGNPAIHILSVDFVDQVYKNFDRFPWHRAHKKIPYVNDDGNTVQPDAPNGYKFETFVFDALRFIHHEPVALSIDRPGEYTPIKSFEGDNSVQAAWATMAEYWAGWLEAAGCPVPRDRQGRCAVPVEISPRFALSQEAFLEKTSGWEWPQDGPLAIGPFGEWITPDTAA